MDYIKSIFFIILLTAIACGCSNDENEKDLSQDAITFFPSVTSTTTRSAMEAGFTEGDQIGLYLYNSSSSTVLSSNVWKSNIKISYNANGPWSMAEELYWQDVPYSSLSCIAYYPYDTKDNQNNLSSVSFDVDTEQNTKKLLRENDLLWAKIDDISYQSYSQGIPLKMSHLFSKVTVTFKNFSSTITDCTLRSAVCEGTLNLTNGEITLSSSSTKNNIKMYYDSETSEAEVIVIPQSFSGAFINFTVGGQRYAYTLSEALTLTSGGEYHISLDGSTL